MAQDTTVFGAELADVRECASTTQQYPTQRIISHSRNESFQ